jgi:hypothetical protein
VRQKRATRASIREVCLLGTAGADWTTGDRVSLSGRSYRVAAAQEGEGDARGYVYLSSVSEG